MSSTRDQLLKLTGRRFRKVGIPGIPDLTVQSLVELERAKVEQAATQAPQTLKRMIVIQSCICGKTRSRLFTEDDMDALASLDSEVIERIVTASLTLSKFTEEDITKLLGEPAAS